MKKISKHDILNRAHFLKIEATTGARNLYVDKLKLSDTLYNISRMKTPSDILERRKEKSEIQMITNYIISNTHNERHIYSKFPKEMLEICIPLANLSIMNNKRELTNSDLIIYLNNTKDENIELFNNVISNYLFLNHVEWENNSLEDSLEYTEQYLFNRECDAIYQLTSGNLFKTKSLHHEWRGFLIKAFTFLEEKKTNHNIDKFVSMVDNAIDYLNSWGKDGAIRNVTVHNKDMELISGAVLHDLFKIYPKESHTEKDLKSIYLRSVSENVDDAIDKINYYWDINDGIKKEVSKKTKKQKKGNKR